MGYNVMGYVSTIDGIYNTHTHTHVSGLSSAPFNKYRASIDIHT